MSEPSTATRISCMVGIPLYPQAFGGGGTRCRVGGTPPPSRARSARRPPLSTGQRPRGDTPDPVDMFSTVRSRVPDIRRRRGFHLYLWLDRPVPPRLTPTTNPYNIAALLLVYAPGFVSRAVRMDFNSPRRFAVVLG